MRMPRLGLTFLIVLLSLGSSSSAAGASQPATSCAGAKCQVYLSLIAYHPQVILLAPASGAAISSLAPVLLWRPPVTGLYRIQVAEDSAFTPTGSFAVSETKDVKSPLPAQVISLINSNLNPRQTYYWRVEKTGKDSGLFTASAYFITLVKDDRRLPPGVQLLSPANDSSVAAQDVLLSWQPVVGALYYRIRVYDSNNVLVSGLPAEVDGATTSTGVPNLTPGMTYHWKVKVLNAYGWGVYLADHYFKVT
jgi:Fibronectin type III domain